MNTTMTGIILAGGSSSRMEARDKHLLKLNGKTILDITLGKMKTIFPEVILVTSHDGLPEYKTVSETGTIVVEDILPGKNALGGIYTGLWNARFDSCFVTACDMPFLNIDLIRHIINIHGEYDITIPVLNGKFEPLHAVYSKNCLDTIRRQIEDGNLKIFHYLRKMKINEIGEDRLRRYDPDLLSFFNVNTKADFEKAGDLYSSIS
ncbi:MAG: molybdenum cofactor guanylyltransferase [Spirochaetales bacterium]|nr:molybdenum cofactor guanylyltransferase [Spirochaetales bacterium]